MFTTGVTLCIFDYFNEFAEQVFYYVLFSWDAEEISDKDLRY